MRRLAMLTSIMVLATGMAASAQTQGQMNEDATRDLRKADQTLNQFYQRLIKAYDPQTKALLVKSQRAWIGYRDADCGLIGSANIGGSVYPMLKSMCLAEHTQDG